MDSSANGSVSQENNINVLSMNFGKTFSVFEKISPAIQEINSGLENTALKVTCTCFQKVSRRPENQIKTVTAITLTQGMMITIKMPKYLVVQNTSGTIPSTTVYHQWGSVTLEASDLFGKKIFEN